MRKLNTKTVVDTYELCKYAEEKYGMNNPQWHKKVWRPYFVKFIMNGPVTFYMEDLENPTNILEEQIKDFLTDYPELNGKVTFQYD